MSERLTTTTENHFETVESMESLHTLSVPASRRGAMTAHTVLQFEQMTEKHGAPRSLTIVPIPGVTLAKYGHNLCNGLPTDVQQGIVNRFEQFAPGQITTDVEEINCTWGGFSTFMQDCAEIAGVGKTTEAILQTINHNADAQLPLADAFSLWDARVLEHLIEKRTRQQVDVLALPPSATKELIESKMGLLPSDRNLFPPDAQMNPLCGRVEAIVVNEMLPAYIDHDDIALETAFYRFHNQLNRALSGWEWQALVDELQFRPQELNGRVREEVEALLKPLFQESGVVDSPEEGWGIYQSISTQQISRRVVEKFVTRSAQPSKLLLAKDRRHRPQRITHDHNDPEAIRYYTGADVLKFILKTAQESGQAVLMQQLGNRPETLMEATSALYGQNGKIKTINALPEDSLPMRDESVFQLM